MNSEKLAEILASHSLWVSSNEVSGERANLEGANLRVANLQGANLQNANLAGANLAGANLISANLRGANFANANLEMANLRWTNLGNANLRSADLRRASLQGADLRWAILRGADFRDATLQGADLENTNLWGADLESADLHYANLDGANLDGAILTGNWQIVPPVGQSFGAFKKVKGGVVLGLLIPWSAQRTSSLIGRKCRANEALVVCVVHGDAYNTGIYESLHDSRFTYEVGKMASEPSFDPDIRVECTTGIHFFMTKEEAISYR